MPYSGEVGAMFYLRSCGLNRLDRNKDRMTFPGLAPAHFTTTLHARILPNLPLPTAIRSPSASRGNRTLASSGPGVVPVGA